MNDELVKLMVERFLQWKLPDNFNPDGGISFKKMYNEHTSHPPQKVLRSFPSRQSWKLAGGRPG